MFISSNKVWDKAKTEDSQEEGKGRKEEETGGGAGEEKTDSGPWYSGGK